MFVLGAKPRERMEALGAARGMRPDELLAILLKTGIVKFGG